eukprot:SAG11_NODE_33329_length_278_cov_0.564246_1_plen_64_part_10
MQSTVITQLLPVTVLREVDFARYSQPAVENPSLLSYLPQLTMLYNLVDKMKAIDNTLHLSASSS